jgi:hypothetical protein
MNSLNPRQDYSSALQEIGHMFLHLLRLFTFLTLAGNAFFLLTTTALADEIGPQAKAVQPVRVSCRDVNWTFNPGQQVERTLEIFNDSDSTEPIDLEWSLQSGGKAYAEGAETFVLQPGSTEKYSIVFRVPPFASEMKGELVLSCLRAGQEVFHDVKVCVIRDEMPEEAPSARPQAVCAPYLLILESPPRRLLGKNRESLRAFQSHRLVPVLCLPMWPGCRRTSLRIP